MQTCETCKWWDRWPLQEYGECLLLAGSRWVSAPVLPCHEDFGCNQWEASDHADV